uniref:SH2 domain-containing protein n=2 Tax=Parascaris univalens TaxID=6257 RepID=A0A914ZZE7_PARUN
VSAKKSKLVVFTGSPRWVVTGRSSNTATPICTWVSYRLKNEKRSIQNLVRVERLIKKEGEKNTGLISVMYLEPISATGLPKTAVGRLIMSVNDVPREILEAKWFAGRMNPVEVGIVLRSEPQYSFGSYLVCQPSEILPHSARWPDYLLVVKCITGSEVQYYHEWEVNYKYNIIYGTTSSYPARAIKNDTMPGMKQPSPTVAFIRVRRTNTGRFYLFDTDKETFYTIYQLLNYYTEQKLTLDMDSAVALRRPAELHSLPISGLKPIEIPIPARAYKSPRHMLGLILVPDRKDTSYSIHILDESEKPSFSGRMCRALLIAEGSNYIVALKRIRSSMVRKSSMQRDLNLLFLERRKQNDHLDEKNRNIYFIQGEEYLCKIAGFGFNDEEGRRRARYE